MMTRTPITKEQLIEIYQLRYAKTQARVDRFFPVLPDFMTLTHITTPLRIAAFLATIGHESGRLLYTEELAKGEKYEGREDLGNVYEGDGRRYKGRGLIQLTGRYNYEQLSIDYGEDFINYPEKLSEPFFAVMSACWFWEKKNLNALADEGRFRDLTRKVNGGLNGWEDRLQIYNRCLLILK